LKRKNALISPNGATVYTQDSFRISTNKKRSEIMKKVLLFLLVFLLAACGTTPTQPVQPTPIIATVLVPVSAPTEAIVPTAVSLPTQAPTEVPTLAPTAVPPTAVPPTAVPPTAVPPTAQVIVVTATNAPVSSGLATTGAPISIDNNLGKGVFINITMSSDSLTLRCSPREITFNIKANLPEITEALLYYRIVDNPAGLYPSEWQNAGKLKGDGNGNFTIIFSGSDVNENLRLDKAWLDVQFVGLNKGGGVVDRTQKIERLITYRKDCP
jgi:hypothetical protein